MPAPAPRSRLRVVCDRPVRGDGEYVLYWMTAARRARYSFALQHAVWHAHEAGRPLLVLEALRAGHQHNTARVHRFVLDGMADNRSRFSAAGVTHFAYVEPSAGAGRGLLAALSTRACVVVTDTFPGYFLPRMLEAAAGQVGSRLEAVDGNGLVPLASTTRVFTTAASFRRVLHRASDELFDAFPTPRPLRGYLGGRAVVPADVLARWPATPDAALTDPGFLRALPLDHDVPAVSGLTGGSRAAEARIERFLGTRLARYPEDARHPDRDGESGLSPYLHFGHVSSHEVVGRILEAEQWHPGKVQPERIGSREGFYGLSPGADAFLDQLVTWRELGFVFSHHRGGDLQRYEALPGWALDTLATHADDPRPWVHAPRTFEQAGTHEPLWNACQRQLRRDGVVHGYLRMLWAKMVLGWSAAPAEAFQTLQHLNDRWAIDGRDPNGYSGVAWCFGRFDRAWGPERPVFGKVRYMTCDASRRKLRLKSWLARHGPMGEGASP